MLRITIPANEFYDESKKQFISVKEQTLQLEHSLVSLSKWESTWCKPFISRHKMTVEESRDYVRCMTLTQNVPLETYYGLTDQNLEEIRAYIDAPMTALRFPDEEKGKINREPITSELIYYWMITLNIPLECQKWHLNKLIALIKLCDRKNRPAKKMSPQEVAKRNAEINAANKKFFNTKG